MSVTENLFHDIELHCCGNNGRITFRRGYVNLRDNEGKETVRWDYLWIDAFKDQEDVNDKTPWIEHGFDPSDAKALMWFLIRNYMPFVSTVWSKLHSFTNKIEDELSKL